MGQELESNLNYDSELDKLQLTKDELSLMIREQKKMKILMLKDGKVIDVKSQKANKTPITTERPINLCKKDKSPKAQKSPIATLTSPQKLYVTQSMELSNKMFQ